MDVKDDVGKQECGLVDNMCVHCERREASKAGHIGFKIKKRSYSKNECAMLTENKTWDRKQR